MNFIDKTLSEVKFSDRKLSKKWHLIELQPKLKEMFKEPPIISYKRGSSLRDILVKAKL